MSTSDSMAACASSSARLGFAVKVIGRPELKSSDARRWQSSPHLRVSIEYLHAIFEYLAETKISMYRMDSNVSPYVTHPDMPQFHNQISECRDDLETLGRKARLQGLRLSFHPSQFIVLNSPDERLVRQSIRDLQAQAEILDTMDLPADAVIVVHVGGHYGDRDSGRQRWIETYRTLPEAVRRRLVLENDDLRYSAADVLAIHRETGVPLVFDHQHHWCFNPERLRVAETLAAFMQTWPSGVRPKIHYSSPRTEMREVKRKDRSTGKQKLVLQPPVWTGHADYVNPFEFALFLAEAGDCEFDVMLEAKAKDLALIRLREDIPRYLPEHADRFGIAVSQNGLSSASFDLDDDGQIRMDDLSDNNGGTAIA